MHPFFRDPWTHTLSDRGTIECPPIRYTVGQSCDEQDRENYENIDARSYVPIWSTAQTYNKQVRSKEIRMNNAVRAMLDVVLNSME